MKVALFEPVRNTTLFSTDRGWSSCVQALNMTLTAQHASTEHEDRVHIAVGTCFDGVRSLLPTSSCWKCACTPHNPVESCWSLRWCVACVECGGRRTYRRVGFKWHWADAQQVLFTCSQPWSWCETTRA